MTSQTEETDKTRCFCGKFKHYSQPVCNYCYRSMDKKCRNCLNHELVHDSNENETYDICKIYFTDLDRVQKCKEHGSFINRVIHNKIMALIDYYNKNNKRYTHYVQLKPNVMVIISWNNHWDYKFYVLEHIKRGKYETNK